MKIRLVETHFDGSVLYVPNDGKAHPGIILLHGSDGGFFSLYRMQALFFAAHGYASLAFCYFGASDSLVGPRETLANIELMRTYEALRWLKESSYVDRLKVAVYGASRGAEQALILASLLGGDSNLVQPDAIAVHAPSDIIHGTHNWDWDDPKCWLSQTELPDQKIWNPACGKNPDQLSPGDNTPWLWKGYPMKVGSRIEIEKYSGPYFISHGKEDEVWEVQKSHRIEAALKAANISSECHYLDKEGHQLSVEGQNVRNELVLQFLARALN